MSLLNMRRRRGEVDPPSPSIGYRERALAARAAPPNSPSLLGPSEPPVDMADVPMLPAESPGVAATGADSAAVPLVSMPAAMIAAPSAPRVRDRMRSPTLFEGVEAPPTTTPAGTRLVKIKERVVTMTRAPCKRASRAARPNEPSVKAREVCRSLVQTREGELKGQGRTKLSADDLLRYRAGAPSGGKGPAIRAQQPEEQSKMNHIAQLKAKNVETHNTEASFLMWGQTAEQCYDRLAESALRSNAVNSSGMGQAAATQCVNAALAIALAESQLRVSGIDVRDPLATNAVDPCLFAEEALLKSKDDDDDDFVGVVTTAQLVYNANPCKLGMESIRSAAKKLARLEIERQAISESMASANYMLTAMCRSVSGGYEIDACWASFVLIVYLCSDPRGRPLLRETNLTDLDVQTACAFEAYGRGEVTRRARLRAQQEDESLKAAETAAKKRRKKGDGGAGPSTASWRSPPRSAVEPCNEDSDSDEWDECITAFGGGHPPEHPIEDDTVSIVNDGDSDSGDEPDLAAAAAVDEPLPDDWLAAEETADQKVLATKRKRASKGYANASTSDAHGIMVWWYKALRSKDKSVLETLITATKTSARDAAASTLEAQTEGSRITTNRVLVEQSAQNAILSAQALVPFVDRKLKDVPTWTAFSVRSFKQKAHVGIGMARSAHGARDAVLHACCRPPTEVRPHPSYGTGVLWSRATQELAVRMSDDPHHTPGILERHGMLGAMRAASTYERGKFKSPFSGRQEVVRNSLDRYIAENTMRALPSALGGLTRSFIALNTTLTLHEHTLECADDLVLEATELHRNASAMNAESRETDLLTCSLIATHTPKERREPYCTPATRLAVGIRVNELMRRFMQGRTRKNEPCKVLLGLHTNAEVGRDVPPIMDTEPLPMATITDFSIRVHGGAAPRQVVESELPLRHLPAKLALHVCLDGAIRAPEMIASVRSSIWQQRGLLYAGSSQASYIGDVGSAVSAAAANANIAMSKKIACADVNTLCLLSIWDTYGGGLTNIHRSFANTPYSGTYGPTLDTGITSSGLLGHFYRSDRRGHGSMTLSVEAADELAAKLAHCHHVEVGDKKYVLAPVQTRGIPHGYVPGVHRVLEDYVEAVDRVATEQSSRSGDTVNGLFSLPFSAFTQALRPDVESTADSTLRHCFRQPKEISCAIGRSYLPDATAEHEALVTEPLFRRPCQASVGDNPFATAYPYVDSVFNAMNALAVIARECGGVDKLHALITQWVEPPVTAMHCDHEAFEPGQAMRGNPLWAADACVLIFGVIYPCQHAIAQTVVSACYAKALPFLAKALRSDHEFKDGGRMWECGPRSEEWLKIYHEAAGRWHRFSCRSAHQCPWKVAVAPMLSLILRKGGSHHNTLEEIAEFRTALNTLCSKGAWLAYSKDGVEPPVAPNPAAGCATMNDVRRPTLDPVFFTQGENLDMGDQRGALVGLHPFQLRQLYSLMLGAHLDNVDDVQVVRNEGGLLLRESALATILENNGKKRTAKGTSYTQIEGDQAAYGGRKAKVYAASFQIEAWDLNAKLQAPLYCAIAPPASKEWRTAGEFGDPSWVRNYFEQEASEQHRTHADEAQSRRRFEAAGSSGLAERAASMRKCG